MVCKHASMVFARQEFQKIIRGYHNRLLREYKAQKYELVKRIHSLWQQYSTETEAIWIGRWNQEQAEMILDNSQRLSAPITGKEFEEVIVMFFRPIVAYVYTIHSLRVRLQMSKSLEVKHDELVGTWELSPYPSGPLYCNNGSYDIDWESVQSLSQSVEGASAPSRAARKRRHRQSRKRKRAILSPRTDRRTPDNGGGSG
jgi:hypothetical protein